MKAVFLFTMWGRHRLNDFVFNYYNQMRKKLSGHMDVTLLVVGSEGDKSKKIAEKNEFEYLEYPNFPLNHKHNAGSVYAKKFNPDILIALNSDSLFSVNYFKGVNLESGVVKGILDFYFFNARTKVLGYWGGYESVRHGEPIGTGRQFGRDALEASNWELWNPSIKINQGIDGKSLWHLKGFGIPMRGNYMKDLDCIGIEIKTGKNITKWEGLRYKKTMQGKKVNEIFKQIGVDNLSILEY